MRDFVEKRARARSEGSGAPGVRKNGNLSGNVGNHVTSRCFATLLQNELNSRDVACFTTDVLTCLATNKVATFFTIGYFLFENENFAFSPEEIFILTCLPP